MSQLLCVLLTGEKLSFWVECSLAHSRSCYAAAIFILPTFSLGRLTHIGHFINGIRETETLKDSPSICGRLAEGKDQDRGGLFYVRYGNC